MDCPMAQGPIRVSWLPSWVEPYGPGVPRSAPGEVSVGEGVSGGDYQHSCTGHRVNMTLGPDQEDCG